ncbi:MBL fold metallo-hydrolase [Nocardiopsis sp. CT-R113]|uniref:MBL fold metallo-hydrolase n=1 Tax=Nocardiopsis codii TaxID=3065942 RepID=A0ABU7KGZ4_9ACTN|nr:MBL fold metallo-hydrolase [Nocardiopsis sp. CT-R113]MEE2041516.1 MBL fold metallo-hydrolase [Nocardiopsis sp. CT-R113]
MPDAPPVEDLGDGVWSLPVPIPGNPLGFTYVYVLTSSDGPVLIDTGWDHDESWEALVRGLAQTGHSVDDVRGAVVTHFHPDHSGLVGRLRGASDAWIAMHPADIAVTAHLASVPAETRRTAIADQLRRAGFPDEDVRTLLGAPHPFTPSAVPDRALEDGGSVDLPGRDLRAVWTPGHSPGHLCLYLADGGRLFTGDHVLPRITPHVGQFPLLSEEGDPLGAFLGSQARVGRLPDADRLVCLPSHETRFTGLAGRAKEIAAHHEQRLDEIAGLLAEGPATLWEVTSRLGWKRAWDDMRVRARHMAASETAAHLRLLQARGLAARSGSDDLPRWVAVAPAQRPA